MKILGLDIGEKRIGVAMADGKIASAYAVIKIDDLAKAILEVSRIVRQENIEKIIIGIPKNLPAGEAGQDTLQADKIHKFALELAKVINLPIEYIDETLTSKEAERILSSSGLEPTSEKYKQEVDKISAKLILEQYINQFNS